MTTLTADNRFGTFLKQLRTSHKAGMAPTARAAGLNRSTLHRWEKGETLPRLTELDALLNTLNATSQQRKQALALMDAPRAQTQVRQQINRIAEHLDIQSLPHGGDLLRAMRIRRGYTLEEAARRIGISEWTLRRWEKGAVWPSVTQVHALCFALQAEEEELIALTCGHLRFSHSHKPPQEVLSPDELYHRLFTTFLKMMQPEQRLTELELLGLKRQAWALATRHKQGPYLLAFTHYTQAYYYHTWGNLVEAGRVAQTAMEALMEIPGGDDFALHAGVIAACAATYGGGRAAPRQGIAILRPWLSYPRIPQVVAWAHSEMAAFLCQCGDTEAGLAMSDQARQKSQGLSPSYQKRRDYSHAEVILHNLHQPSRALEFLPATEGESPHFQMEIEMLRAEILTALKEVTDAQKSLEAVVRLQGDNRTEATQARIASLTQRL